MAVLTPLPLMEAYKVAADWRNKYKKIIEDGRYQEVFEESVLEAVSKYLRIGVVLISGVDGNLCSAGPVHSPWHTYIRPYKTLPDAPVV